MSRMKSSGPSILLVLLGMLLMAPFARYVGAQDEPGRKPIDFAVATTDNGNFIMYRMWSDGLIDVRLINPLNMTPQEWPDSGKGGLSFQERWKILQFGH